MAKFVKLDPNRLSALREIDERLVSYNIEMTEVTGGTFWKAYSEDRLTVRKSSPSSRIGPIWATFSSGTIPSTPPIPG